VMAMKDGADPAAQRMLARQLPLIVERLEHATARIRKPSDESMRMEAVQRWWQRQPERFAGKPISWQAAASGDQAGELPAALFDNVLENLLDNALAKHLPGKATAISASLLRLGGQWGIEVQDDGDAIPAAQAEALFLAPQPSDAGLGIGLYQASRLAESAGYQLALVENRDACVRFRLAPLQRA